MYQIWAPCDDVKAARVSFKLERLPRPAPGDLETLLDPLNRTDDTCFRSTCEPWGPKIVSKLFQPQLTTVF